MIQNSRMFGYIKETPAVLSEIMQNRKEIAAEFVAHYREIPIEQIYLIGSGTSFHAGLSAKVYLEEVLNLKVIAMYPTQFERNEGVYNKNTLVIGMSQGGQSLSTVAGLNAARKKGLHTAAVSENPEALIFEHADTATRIKVGNEQCGAKTKGYAGSILTLMLMLTELAVSTGKMKTDSERAYLQRMNRVIDNLDYVIEESIVWYQRIREEFISAKRIIVVGYDGLYGDVLEGALKILETVREGVEGYDIEEFFHGIYNSITDRAHIFYLASQGDYKMRTLKLIDLLSEWTSHNYLISSSTDIEDNSEKDLLLNFVEDPLFSSWEYIIPLQMIACLAPQERGINPDIPKDTQFHAKIGSKTLDGIRDSYQEDEMN